MKQGKKIKPKILAEYRLLIAQRQKELEKKDVTLVALRTTSEFTNFRYEIIVEYNLEDRTLYFKIGGLRAPQISIPASGPAIYKTEINDLYGKYMVVISKQNNEENKFSINVKKNKIDIIEDSPKNRFVEIITNENEW